MRVAFLGLGLMGAPMATNLVRAGHDVTVWNRTESRCAPLAAAGADVAATPAAAAEGADAVCLALPTGAEVRAVLEDGVIAALELSGGSVVDHSTIAPADARSLAHSCSDSGVGFLDAPVSGGPWGAAAGTLCVMVGGDADVVARNTAVLEASAATVIHVGPSGSGQVVKLANNLTYAVTTLGIVEAFHLARAEGVDPATTLEVLTSATADSRALQQRAPVPGLQPDMPASNDWAPGFATDMMAKDLELAIAAAHEDGLALPATALARTVLELAQQAGLGGRDFSVFATLTGPR
ncbi:MAG: NAD(P)-dependent oxidoreductase [Acidimicrobiia bacterium]|nr:NAD(P)-dependent oxidoreductase [Acidimicrobiia bacterium]